MALITTGDASGNGGSLPSAWTVDAAGDLEIAPTDNTADYLTSVKAPAGFFDNSPNGTMLRLTDENGNVIHEFLVEGDYNQTAPTGFNQAIIRLLSVDKPLSKLTLGSGTESGTDAFIEAKNNNLIVFNVSDTGIFRLRPASDDIVFNLQAVDNATSISFYVNAAPGQTGNLVEIDTLPDGNPGFIIKPDGAIIAPMLPTADPHVAGQLWNSSGVVHVSAG